MREFGQTSYRLNGETAEGQYTYGVAAVMYDVLNCIGVNNSLSQTKAYEVD